MDNNTLKKAAWIASNTYCEGGQCTKMSRGICKEPQSSNYLKKGYHRCEHFTPDSPERNKKLIPDQRCANCRFQGYYCNCWKMWSSNRDHRGTSCHYWQRETKLENH